MHERTRLFFVVTVAVFLLFFMSGCLPSSAATAPTPAPTPTPPSGEMQKDFTLQTIDGESFTLGDHLGRPIVVSFFRPGCFACHLQIAPLNSIHAKYQNTRNLLVLGVGRGTQEAIAAYAVGNGMKHPVVVDTTGEVSNLYGVSPIPHTFFIDRQGKIVFSPPPGLLTVAALESYLERTW